MDSLVSILERDPEPLGVAGVKSESQSLQFTVDKALRKDRAERYATADDLLSDLKHVREQGSLELPAASLSQGLTTRAPKSSLRAIIALAFALTLALVVGAIALKQPTPPQASIVNPASGSSTTKAYLQMSGPEQLEFVSEQEQRVSAMMGDRPVKLNDEALRAIKTYIDSFVLSGQPDDVDGVSLKATFSRAQTYVPLIARSFAARKVPVIVGIYLPVVESNYRSCYENAAGAKGLFQFLPGTARQYGVSHEEMCDVEKMAPAAAHYIADRMAELGEDSQSLTLVLLSYNRGPEGVRDALRELRDTDNYQRNFWTLFAHRDKLDEQFRKESAGYVPAFFAAAIIGENPRVFELPTPPLSTLAGQ